MQKVCQTLAMQVICQLTQGIQGNGNHSQVGVMGQCMLSYPTNRSKNTSVSVCMSSRTNVLHDT